MNEIRKRLKEPYLKSGGKKPFIWGDDGIVTQFIQPILDYGNQEEIRITKSFHKDRKCKCDVCGRKWIYLNEYGK
mgnify:CR=1 FL=1